MSAPRRNCPACGRDVARYTAGGRQIPHGKRTARHKCPHGVWCMQGHQNWGQHSNGRQTACQACLDEYTARQKAADYAKGAR